MEDRETLANEHLQLQFLRGGELYTGYTLSVRSGDGLAPLGLGRFGRLVYRDTAGERRETPIRLSEVAARSGSAHLRGQWADADGVEWTFEQSFELQTDARQIVVRCRAVPSERRDVLHWSGPTFYAGEGAFGANKTDALFPGIEYLLDEESSSSTAFASEKHALRCTPHPYKITVPLMAVSHGGLAVGLMWDPNQAYGSAWRHPAATFSSPNRLEDEDNHLLSLFAPGVPRFVPENAQEAERPFGVSSQNPLLLEARLVALAGATAVDVLKLWIATFGLPAIEPPHSYRDNVDLCVRSYLDVAWDAAARGWHHTLSDPWGPRYEPRVIAQLWRYGQLPSEDANLRARARQQVRDAIGKVIATEQDEVSSSGQPFSVPHLELALHYGQVPHSLAALRKQVQARLAEQAPNGAWVWQSSVIQGGSFNTEERQRLMGQAGDSSTGLTADRAQPLLRWARLTGDEVAREAGLRAVAWCNAQRRPEGAQTWELHLHVPDVLAVPYLIDINLAAYELTGDASYLAAAERWAWTGLPFTYLWAAYYRPIMAYCTIPVFGVTFHDVQSWFGVDVHWNGLVYADALFRLAEHAQATDWRAIARGITACGMAQQQTSGPWLGMYPDAMSMVRGEEEYTWWLNPNLIGLNTFELAGIPLDITTHTLERADGPALRVTSGAQVVDLRLDGPHLSLSLEYPAGAWSYTVIAGLGRPVAVDCEGKAVPEIEDLDQDASGWRWLAELGLMVIKVSHAPAGAVMLTLTAA